MCQGSSLKTDSATTADQAINNDEAQDLVGETQNPGKDNHPQRTIGTNEYDPEHSSEISDEELPGNVTSSESFDRIPEVVNNSNEDISQTTSGPTEAVQSDPASAVEQEGFIGKNRYTPVNMDQKKSRYVLKSGDSIRYKANEDNKWVEATVLGPAGSAKGVNRNWYNVQPKTGKDLSVNIRGHP